MNGDDAMLVDILKRDINHVFLSFSLTVAKSAWLLVVYNCIVLHMNDAHGYIHAALRQG